MDFTSGTAEKEMNPTSKISYRTYTVVFLAGLSLLTGCASTSTTPGEMQSPSGFVYDQGALAGATPWTSEKFKNDPNNFQFAIIGDRTGGHNVQGTFDLAMNQLNLLQPEFIMSVGDLIEGYTDDKTELNEMWDETENMTAKLQMPFFYTIGNHDVQHAAAKEVWLERHGADYYHFLYNNVLFMVLNSEDNSRPEPPPGKNEFLETYNRLQTENPEAAKKLLAEFMKDESVVAGLSKPVEFPEEQMASIKKTLADNADVRWTLCILA